MLLDYVGKISEKPITKFPFLFSKSQNEIELIDYLNAIEYATNDDNIKGIVINGDLTFYNYAHTEEIVNSLNNFKKSGKKIFAWFSTAINRNYSLCLVADEIYMPDTDSANLTITGYSQSIPYFKEGLDKLGLGFNVIHIGDYKGTGENYIRNTMSNELKKSYSSLFNDLYNGRIKQISESRNIEENKIKLAISLGNTILMTPTQAKKIGFIDEKKSYSKLIDSLSVNNIFTSISFFDYLSTIDKKKATSKIAIIYAEGLISNYYSGQNKFSGNMTGAKTFISDLKVIKNDKNIKAIILRINSGGGSALASELILQAINDLKEKNQFMSLLVP